MTANPTAWATVATAALVEIDADTMAAIRREGINGSTDVELIEDALCSLYTDRDVEDMVGMHFLGRSVAAGLAARYALHAGR